MQIPGRDLPHAVVAVIRPLTPMTRPLAAALCAAAVLLFLPAVSAAATGGAGFALANSQNQTTAAQPGNLIVSASANGMTIAARESALLRNWLWVSGSLPASDARQTLEIQIAGPRTGGTWQQAAQTRVSSNGSYSTGWRTNQVGQFALRAVLVQPGAAAMVANGLPTISVTVYRPSIATLYGPGFYGSRTACGIVLRPRTIGVANRTLPCGTPVAIYYRGRVMTVPVIDRGPYANGANWDLTMAAGKVLGMTATETIGAIPLPRAAQQSALRSARDHQRPQTAR